MEFTIKYIIFVKMDKGQTIIKNYANFNDEEEKKADNGRVVSHSPQTTQSQLAKQIAGLSTNRMTIKEEEAILSKLQTIALGMLIAPVLIFVCGLIAYYKTEKEFLIVPPFISSIAFFAALTVYFSAKSTKDSLTRHKKMVTQWNGVVAQDVMSGSLYVLHVTASCYFFIGIISFISHQILLGPIDKPELNEKVKLLLFLISGASLKYILGYTYIFYLSCKLSIDYETIQNYVQAVQFSVLLSGIGLVLCPGVYWWY